MPQSDFLHIIKSRGFLHQCTDEAGLDALLKSGAAVPAYIGFDCTAKSLHVGSLLQIMLLRWWQKCGHKPIVLMGGGTTKVGDPSGKDESRPQLTDADIAANMESLQRVFAQFLTFGEGASNALMVNNDDWLKGINYINFLRDYGRHFSVNRMMSMDSVKLRLERDQHLSFLEFNYMILQAYDFVELNRLHGCRVQMGGSDQWGNIVMGVDLASKVNREDYSKVIYEKLGHHGKKDVFSFDDPVNKDLDMASIYTDQLKSGKSFSEAETVKYLEVIKKITSHLESSISLRDSSPEFKKLWSDTFLHHKESRLFGITSPLMTTASGAKMGKTAAGAVWLNADLTSPYDYWQFWRNAEDADVGKFLKLFTELEVAECERLGALEGAQINEAKKILATEATALLHGRKAAEKAAQTATDTFAGVGVSADLPEIMIPRAELQAGMAAYKLFFAAGLAESGGKARKLIEGKGARMNDVVVENADAIVSLADMNADGFIKLSSGKKKHVLVKAD